MEIKGKTYTDIRMQNIIQTPYINERVELGGPAPKLILAVTQRTNPNHPLTLNAGFAVCYNPDNSEDGHKNTFHIIPPPQALLHGPRGTTRGSGQAMEQYTISYVNT